MAKTSYLIALGSNRRHGRHGRPERVLAAAMEALGAFGRVAARSRVRSTPALGPAGRGFANAAVRLDSELDPPALLGRLKKLERDFGRRGGRKWGPRVLDLDIILWSQGPWASDGLHVPHPEFRRRRFVLDPLAEIAPEWRDPVTNRTLRQLLVRARTPRSVDRGPCPF